MEVNELKIPSRWTKFKYSLQYEAHPKRIAKELRQQARSFDNRTLLKWYRDAEHRAKDAHNAPDHGSPAHMQFRALEREIKRRGGIHAVENNSKTAKYAPKPYKSPVKEHAMVSDTVSQLITAATAGEAAAVANFVDAELKSLIHERIGIERIKVGVQAMQQPVEEGRFNVFTKHEIAIAKKTLKMPDALLGVMGGMTKDQAREILKRHGITVKEEATRGLSRFLDFAAPALAGYFMNESPEAPSAEGERDFVRLHRPLQVTDRVPQPSSNVVPTTPHGTGKGEKDVLPAGTTVDVKPGFTGQQTPLPGGGTPRGDLQPVRTSPTAVNWKGKI